MAEILKADESRFSFAVDYAARLIRAGKVVAVPTDTLYGLAADPFNLAAVNEVFASSNARLASRCPSWWLHWNKRPN